MVRKIKIGRIEVSFSDRWLYTFIALGIIILLGVVVYGWSNSAGVGHGLDEIQPCGDGEILKTSSGSWSCVDAPIDTNANTECPTGQYLDGDGNCHTAAQIVSNSNIVLTNCAWTGYTGCMWHCAVSCPSGKTPINGASDNCIGGDSHDDLVSSHPTATGWKFEGSYTRCAVLCCD